MKGVIDRKLNNNNLKSAVAALQGKWGYLDIGKDSVDMDLMESQDKTLSRIANALGCDADLFLSGQSFSNKEWAQKNLVLQLVMPLCTSLRDELNRRLVPAFKGQFFCDFDFSLIPELQDDITKMSTVWNGMFDRGMLNGNEVRELAGFDKSTEPLHDQYLITGNYSLIEDVTMPEEEEPDEEVKKYNDYGN
jgi:phage portal protein BeeE